MEVERGIPNEIITDILCRLPIKCLLRLRCVCKLWRSIISGSHFINLQLERARRDPKIIISFYENDDGYASLNFLIADKNGLPIHKWTNVGDDRVSYPYRLGRYFHPVPSSCNGLLCFYGSKDIYVCNPSTHQMKLLPKSSSSSDLVVGCGFGFDPSTKKYKVIKLTNFPGSDSVPPVYPQWEILTLGSGSWRSIDMPPLRVITRSVFVSGKIHWINDISGQGDCQILSFDVGNETFEVIPPPACIAAAEWYCFRMAEVGGYLCLSKIQFDGNGGLMNLWILKDYANHGWIKQSITFPFKQHPVPVAIQNEEVLVCICEGWLLRKFRSYNLQSKSWAEMADLPGRCLLFHSYVDSLIPLEMDPDPPEDDGKNRLKMQIREKEMKPDAPEDDDKNVAEDAKGDQE